MALSWSSYIEPVTKEFEHLQSLSSAAFLQGLEVLCLWVVFTELLW